MFFKKNSQVCFSVSFESTKKSFSFKLELLPVVTPLLLYFAFCFIPLLFHSTFVSFFLVIQFLSFTLFHSVCLPSLPNLILDLEIMRTIFPSNEKLHRLKVMSGKKIIAFEKTRIVAIHIFLYM